METLYPNYMTMKKTIRLITGILLIAIHSVVAQTSNLAKNAGLSGKITDQDTGEPLPGVSIYFPSLSTGAQTNSKGMYSIHQLPATKLLVQVSFVGYKIQTAIIDLSTTNTRDFKLKKSVTEISEVVVTGQLGGIEHNRTPSPIEVVPRTKLLQSSSSNIIDALADVPGVSQVTTIKGNLMTNYQTNNGLAGYSANLAGNKNGLIWDARYSGKHAHAYENKYDGPVFNSAFRENAASGMLGINRAWGFSHLNLGWYHLKPGIVEGERDSLTGKFLKPVILSDGDEGYEIATDDDLDSYQPHAPFQKITHYKAVWDNSLFLGQSNLQSTIGFQQNHRKEFEEADDYGLYFLLKSEWVEKEVGIPRKYYQLTPEGSAQLEIMQQYIESLNGSITQLFKLNMKD